MPSPSVPVACPGRLTATTRRPPAPVTRRGPLWAGALLLVAATLTAAEPEPVADINARGLAAHRQRNLGEASRQYNQVLERDAAVAPTDAQRALVLRFAPRLHAVAGEYFPLKDLAAIHHPDRPVIGYHLFWEDDLGYPADNEPCDHEIVWVEYEPATLAVVRVSTYFHGRLQSTAAAAGDANAHGGRPWVGVEWGFHGSVLLGAVEDETTGARAKLHEHWARAHAPSPTVVRSPLARGWPERFSGGFAEYLAFAEPVDAVSLLRDRGLIWISRWPTATLNRRCLRYNFAAKTEWPWLF